MKLPTPTLTLVLSLTLTHLTTAYVGDMTYYDPSSNSCGLTLTEGEDVVALSKAVMGNGGNPNANGKVCFVFLVFLSWRF